MACIYSQRVTSIYKIVLKDYVKSLMKQWIQQSNQNGNNKKLRNSFSFLESDEMEEENLLLDHDYVNLVTRKPKNQSKQIYFVYMCWLIIGLGYAATWTSISFPISAWRHLLGVGTWQQFVLCYSSPGLFAFLALHYTDERVENAIGKRRAYMLRIIFSFIILIAVSLAMCIVDQLNRSYILGVVSILGIMQSVIHIWLFQLAAMFPPKCTSMLMSGMLICVAGYFVFSLIFIVELDGGISLLHYFGGSVVLNVLALFSFIFMMATGTARGYILRLENDQKLRLGRTSSSRYVLGSFADRDKSEVMNEFRFGVSWQKLFSIFFVMFTTTALIGCLSYFPANQPHQLPVITIFVLTCGYFFGNEVGGILRFQNDWALITVATLRSCMLAFFLCYTYFKFLVNDLLFYAMIALFAVLGSYSLSRAFEKATEDKAKGVLWVNIVFFAGVYVGMTVPFWFSVMLQSR